jgi:hypothetical protein
MTLWITGAFLAGYLCGVARCLLIAEKRLMFDVQLLGTVAGFTKALALAVWDVIGVLRRKL